MERGLLLTLAHPYFLRNEAQTWTITYGLIGHSQVIKGIRFKAQGVRLNAESECEAKSKKKVNSWRMKLFSAMCNVLKKFGKVNTEFYP